MKRHFKYGFLSGSILLILQFVIIKVVNKMGINIPFLYQVVIYVLILSIINGIIFYLLRDKTQSYYMPNVLRNILKKILTIKKMDGKYENTCPESYGSWQCEMSGRSEENTGLVIKSIGTAKQGFKNFGDIEKDTDLPLNDINAALDWLVMNEFATVVDGRRGRVYELSHKGRNTFSSIINPKSST